MVAPLSSIRIIKYGSRPDVRTLKTVHALKTMGYVDVAVYNPIENYQSGSVRRVLQFLTSLVRCGTKREANGLFWGIDLMGGLWCAIRCVPTGNRFVYEVYDEIHAITESPVLSFITRTLDKLVSRLSTCTIRVASYRIESKQDVVIRNLPSRANTSLKTHQNNWRKIIVFSGQLIESRGLEQAFAVASTDRSIYLAIFGHNLPSKYKKISQSLKNVYYFGPVPQKRVYRFQEKCVAYFAMYDPRLPINRLAASNKFYEWSVTRSYCIVNTEVLASREFSDLNSIRVPYNMSELDIKLLGEKIKGLPSSESMNPKFPFFEDEFSAALQKVL